MRTTSLSMIALSACLALYQANASPAPAQQDAGPMLIIDDVTLIDVEHSRALPHQTVTIVGERIERIDEAANAHIPDGAKIIAGKGLYLIPGLIDAHVHFTTSQETFGPMMLANGVTACRDTEADTNTILDLREQSHQRGAMLPHIICTGAIIDGVPPVWPFSEPCDTPDEARAAVRKLHAAGVDQIKVYSLLKPEVHRAAVEEAHTLKIKATGHVPNAMSLAQAIEAGQDCVEHLTGFERMLVELTAKTDNDREGIWPGLAGWMRYPDIDKAKLRERLALVAKADMMQCPTLVAIRGVGSAADPENANKDERMAYVPAGLLGFWSGDRYAEFGKLAGQTVPHMQAMVDELHRAGVPLMIGTDLANPYVFAGFSVHDEMKMFQAAGIPAIDVLRSATIIPARFCDAQDDLGSIAPGKLASMALLRANPLEDIANASEIQGVFVRGVHHNREALDKMLAAVRANVSSTAPLAAANVDMNLPGEVVARGRYVMKFNGQFDAGAEDFVITRDNDGYHIRAHSRPQGGFQSPALVDFNVDANFAFTSGRMRRLTQAPLTATYALSESVLTATATEGGDGAKPQHFRMPGNGVVSASISACDFAIFGALRDMKVDEQRDLQAVGFGFAGWQVGAVPYSVTRKPDEEIALPDGAKAMARRYATTMTAQGMELNGEAWIDERGVLLKNVLRAPFGMIETALVSLKRQ